MDKENIKENSKILLHFWHFRYNNGMHKPNGMNISVLPNILKITTDISSLILALLSLDIECIIPRNGIILIDKDTLSLNVLNMGSSVTEKTEQT